MSLIWKMPSNLEHLNCTNKSTQFDSYRPISPLWINGHFPGSSFYFYFHSKFQYSIPFHHIFVHLSMFLAPHSERENIYEVNIIMSFMSYNFFRQLRWSIERWSVVVSFWFECLPKCEMMVDDVRSFFISLTTFVSLNESYPL